MDRIERTANTNNEYLFMKDEEKIKKIAKPRENCLSGDGYETEDQNF